MRIVLDTNVLINGFKDSHSTENKIIDEVLTGNLLACANKQTLRENKSIARKLIDNDEYQARLNELFSKIHWVVNRRQINIVSDRQDNKILESAVEAEAEFLISSDNDLLRLEEYQNVKIVNPTQFWSSYKDEGMELWKQWANYISE